MCLQKAEWESRLDLRCQIRLNFLSVCKCVWLEYRLQMATSQKEEKNGSLRGAGMEQKGQKPANSKGELKIIYYEEIQTITTGWKFNYDFIGKHNSC